MPPGRGRRQTLRELLVHRRGIQLDLMAFYDIPQFLPRTLPHLLQKAHFHMDLKSTSGYASRQRKKVTEADPWQRLRKGSEPHPSKAT